MHVGHLPKTLGMNVTRQHLMDIKTEDTPRLARQTVPELDEILGLTFRVLDHGFIRAIDYMGSDQAVENAARLSYAGGGTRKVSSTIALINYLIRHRHTSPFEMAEIQLHMKLPIFVARQMVRHRTASLNEISARYSILDNEFYIPSLEQYCIQSSDNKQGRGETLSPEQAQFVMHALRQHSADSYNVYETLLNENRDGKTIDPSVDGLARELARMGLTLNFYTQWVWKTDVNNLMKFLALRQDSHAQYEIRAYADVMYDIFSLWMPITSRAYREYVFEAFSLSKTMQTVVNRTLAGEVITQENSGLSSREWRELVAQFPGLKNNAFSRLKKAFVAALPFKISS